MIRAVAFDLDDTLAVTDAPRERLLEAAAERARVELTFDRADYVRAHREHSGGANRRPVFEALVEEDAAAFTHAYREAVGEAITPVEGAIDAVEALRERYRVGLLTDGPEDTQLDKLRRLGWEAAFDVVVVTGGIDAPKPAAEAFAALSDRLDVAPETVVYVGDNPDRDIAGATAAGMAAIQVVYERGPDVHPSAVGTIRRSELATLPARLEAIVGDGIEDA